MVIVSVDAEPRSASEIVSSSSASMSSVTVTVTMPSMNAMSKSVPVVAVVMSATATTDAPALSTPGMVTAVEKAPPSATVIVDAVSAHEVSASVVSKSSVAVSPDASATESTPRTCDAPDSGE